MPLHRTKYSNRVVAYTEFFHSLLSEENSSSTYYGAGPSCYLKILALAPIEFIRARCSSMRRGVSAVPHPQEDYAKTDIH